MLYYGNDPGPVIDGFNKRQNRNTWMSRNEYMVLGESVRPVRPNAELSLMWSYHVHLSELPLIVSSCTSLRFHHEHTVGSHNFNTVGMR